MIVKTSETNCVWKGDFSAQEIFFSVVVGLVSVQYGMVWYNICASCIWYWLIQSIGFAQYCSTVFLLISILFLSITQRWAVKCGDVNIFTCVCVYFISSFFRSLSVSRWNMFYLVSFRFIRYIYMHLTLYRDKHKHYLSLLLPFICIVYRNIMLTARDIHRHLLNRRDKCAGRSRGIKSRPVSVPCKGNDRKKRLNRSIICISKLDSIQRFKL